LPWRARMARVVLPRFRGRETAPPKRTPKEWPGPVAKSAAGSGPTKAPKQHASAMPIHSPSAPHRHPSGLGRTVKRDFPPRHATPSRTPRNASNVVAPTAGMLRTNCTERQRPLGPYLRRANWTANSWAACVMSAAATEWKPSQVYCLNFVTPPAPAFGAAGSPRAAARCRQIPRAASQSALSRTAGASGQ
jgi:hypothetical protein